MPQWYNAATDEMVEISQTDYSIRVLIQAAYDRGYDEGVKAGKPRESVRQQASQSESVRRAAIDHLKSAGHLT